MISPNITIRIVERTKPIRPGAKKGAVGSESAIGWASDLSMKNAACKVTAAARRSAEGITASHLGQKNGEQRVHSDIPKEEGAEQPISTLVMGVGSAICAEVTV